MPERLLDIDLLFNKGLDFESINLISASTDCEKFDEVLLQSTTWIIGRIKTIIEGMEASMQNINPEIHTLHYKKAVQTANETFRRQYEMIISMPAWAKREA